jgi:hypothetical protein
MSTASGVPEAEQAQLQRGCSPYFHAHLGSAAEPVMSELAMAMMNRVHERDKRANGKRSKRVQMVKRINTDCYRCFLEKRTTPGTWVTGEGDVYCSACLEAEGIDQAACVSIEQWRSGRLPTAPELITHAGCLRPGCTGTHRVGSRHPFCLKCQKAGFHSTKAGKALLPKTLQLNPTSTTKGVPDNILLASAGENPKSSPATLPADPNPEPRTLCDVYDELRSRLRPLAETAVDDLVIAPVPETVSLELKVTAEWLDLAWMRLDCGQKSRALSLVLAE